MSNSSWVIKQVPTDFMVFESAALSLFSLQEPLPFIYLKVKKYGFTTFEVVEKLSLFCHLPISKITYGGLKDEDGITEQSIAIEGHISIDSIRQFNLENYRSLNNERFIEISLQGKGLKPMMIGEILGNIFQVTIRNLSLVDAKKIEKMKKCSFFFINYYDLQRFGLPNKPRVTHLVGKNLLQENYKQAFDFLKELGGSTGEKATLFQDPPQSFFDRLECREKCFYKNSYSSYLWNQELFDQIALMGGDYTFTYEYEGILYCFSHSQNILHKVIQNAAELPIIRYFSDGQQELSKESSRTTIIQTCIRVTDTTEDEYHPNKWKNVVEFFLPSGCYATMLVKQLISSIQSS